MKYTKQVEAALDNAMPVAFDGILDILPEQLQDEIIFNIPAEAEDTYPVEFPSREQIIQPANSLYIDSPRKVKNIVAEYSRQTQVPYDAWSFDFDTQEESAEAVQILGGSVLYAVNFFKHGQEGDPHRMSERTLTVVPYDWETTKLGYAIQKMYPLHPSGQDEKDIRSLGYANRMHVVDLAMQHDLPVPLLSPRRRPTVAAKIFGALQRKGLWRS